MKKTLNIVTMLLFLIFFVGISFSKNNNERGKYGSDPMKIFEDIVSESNKGGYAIQETALDGISSNGSYPPSFKVSNTLDYIRNNLDPYLQWAIYVGLVLATIAFIYLGFLLVTNGVHNEGNWTKLKKNIMYVLIGVFLLSGFYFIIKLMVALITSIFGGSTGNSGF